MEDGLKTPKLIAVLLIVMAAIALGAGLWFLSTGIEGVNNTVIGWALVFASGVDFIFAQYLLRRLNEQPPRNGGDSPTQNLK